MNAPMVDLRTFWNSIECIIDMPRPSEHEKQIFLLPGQVGKHVKLVKRLALGSQ